MYEQVPVVLELPGGDDGSTEVAAAWCRLFPDTCQLVRTQLIVISALLYPHDTLGAGGGRRLDECRLQVTRGKLGGGDGDGIPACASADVDAETGRRVGRIQVSGAYVIGRLRVHREATATEQPEHQLSIVNDARYELTGVLTHELCHLVQFDGQGTAPWWFVEGLADFVRLLAGQAARHWRRPVVPEWLVQSIAAQEASISDDDLIRKIMDDSVDAPKRLRGFEAGYATTGFFFRWAERRHPHTILRMNGTLSTDKWDESMMRGFSGGRTLEELWVAYLVAEHHQIQASAPSGQ